MGRPLTYDELRARVSIWPPLRLARMRCERESVGVVCPPVLLRQPLVGRREHATLYRTGRASRVRRGGDLGGRGRPLGGPDQDDTGGDSPVAGSLCEHDEVAIEATCNTHAIARLLERHVGRVVVSNPLKTRAIAEAKVKTDKVDAQVLAQLLAAGQRGTRLRCRIDCTRFFNLVRCRTMCARRAT